MAWKEDDPVRHDNDGELPPKSPRTLVDIDSPDDAEFPGGPEGPEDDELPEIEVPEIEAPDDGDEILENSRGKRLFRNV